VSVLSLDQANRLIAAVLAEAARRGLPPVAVAVLDHGGYLKALQRQDGVSFMRASICQAKAWGALAMGTDSRQLARRFADDPLQQAFLQALNAMADGRIVALPGGVLVRDDAARIVGAVGVAGAASDQDEACAVAGIGAIGLHSTVETDD
jgi:uncharacterized protein GlcG (DUF336 family)